MHRLRSALPPPPKMLHLVRSHVRQFVVGATSAAAAANSCCKQLQPLFTVAACLMLTAAAAAAAGSGRQLDAVASRANSNTLHCSTGNCSFHIAIQLDVLARVAAKVTCHHTVYRQLCTSPVTHHGRPLSLYCSLKMFYP